MSATPSHPPSSEDAATAQQTSQQPTSPLKATSAPLARLPLALDAMGGDHAPEVTVAGAVQAQQEGYAVLLVGDQAKLSPLLAKHGSSLPVHHCEDVITMEDSPRSARTRKDSSIVQACQLVKDGKASACVSMGHSGATMAAALGVLGRLPGIERPVLAVHIPTRRGLSVLVDGGANSDCKANYLLQFAIMGSALMKSLHGIVSPSVGLVSIGEESSKGNALTLEAHGLLAEAGEQLNFYGNIEGRDLLAGTVDVVVTDGFTGNIMLKQAEGDAKALFGFIRDSIAGAGIRAKLGAWLLRPALRSIRERLEPSEYGAQPLLGLRGCAMIGHGSSDARAVYNAIKTTQRLVDAKLIDTIAASVSGSS